MPEKTQLLTRRDPIAWVLANHFLNENGSPMEFDNFAYLIDPFTDMARRQAIMKCAQAGYSTLAIFKEFWLAQYHKANSIHILPTKTITKDFVTPKVDKIITQNPEIQKLMGETDSVNLKAVGDRFIYYRGAFAEEQAIMISANALLRDEYDKCDPGVLETYLTRLGESSRERPDLGLIWDFSNPSHPNFGIHALYLKSDQKRWVVRCGKCKIPQTMVWPESVDKEREAYVCRKCGTELTTQDRKMGKWLPRFPGREISGYHIHKLMIPWVSAKEVIEASEGDTQIFYNFWLGLPYAPADLTLSREAIIKAIVLTENPKTQNVMGVDNGVEKHYVIGNRWGIFRYGKTKSWAEIERLHNEYNAITVIDALPYPYYPTLLAKKYRNRLFIQYFSQDTKNLGVIRWGRGDELGKVNVDRSKILDTLVTEITGQEITFNLPQHELEPLIAHCESVYRQITDEGGKVKVDWVTQANRPDHWFFGLQLLRTGLDKRLLAPHGGPVRPPRPGEKKKIGFQVTRSGFEGQTGPHVPGYDYRQKFDEEVRRKVRDERKLFNPPVPV